MLYRSLKSMVGIKNGKGTYKPSCMDWIISELASVIQVAKIDGRSEKRKKAYIRLAAWI